MKRIKPVTGFACALLIFGVAQSSIAAVKVPSTEQQQWLRWVIPLHLPRSAPSGIVTIAERRTPCSYSKLGM